MTEYRVTLDTVKKWRNASEFRPVNRARCGSFEVVGDGDIERKIAREMTAAGLSGKMSVWRGKTQVFRAIPLEIWANGKAMKGEQPAQLRASK